MAGWQIGLVITMAVGVAVIVFGALWDRERNRRRAEQLSRPPARPIPGHGGEAPEYVTPDTPIPHRAPVLTDERRAELDVRLSTAPAFNAVLADRALVNDPSSGWAVLDHAIVVVCAEPVETLREVLPLLDQGASSQQSIVLVAPGFGTETLRTLIVNHLHQTLRIAVILAEGTDLSDVASATGALPVSRLDLRAGWIPRAVLGRVTTWVSSSEGSWIAEA